EAEALGPVGGARVLGVDGAAYFSRPGPRLVDGVELLASLFHPDAVGAVPGAVAVRASAFAVAATSARSSASSTSAGARGISTSNTGPSLDLSSTCSRPPIPVALVLPT